jgi:large subunit ribosomal protein L15
LAVVKLQATVVPPLKVIKVPRAVPVLKANGATKVDRCPYKRRIPKRGFKNISRVEYKVFNLGQIEQLAEKYGVTDFSLETLYVNGLINRTDKVKILGNGELKTKITFKVNASVKKPRLPLKRQVEAWRY